MYSYNSHILFKLINGWVALVDKLAIVSYGYDQSGLLHIIIRRNDSIKNGGLSTSTLRSVEEVDPETLKFLEKSKRLIPSSQIEEMKKKEVLKSEADSTHPAYYDRMGAYNVPSLGQKYDPKTRTFSPLNEAAMI